MILRKLILLLALVCVTRSQDDFNPDEFDNAETEDSSAQCSAGFYLDGGVCKECPAGTKAKPDETGCDQCPLDTYSTGTTLVCTDCEDGKGTVSTGSTSADACVTVCVVPEVKFTKGATTAAGTRVESGSTSDIECETDYQYGGLETSTVTCDVSLDNNGYPSSCRKISVELLGVNSIKAGDPAFLTCHVETGDNAMTGISWFKGETELKDSDVGVKIEVDAAESDDGETFTRESRLTLDNLDSDDAGTDYSCKVNYASPILSDQSKAVTITVLDLVLDPADTTQIISVGDGLSLQCKMISDDNFDERSIEWYFNGASDPLTSEDGVAEGETSPYKHKTVTKSPAAITDSGTYRCEGMYKSTDYSPVIIDKTYTVYVRGFSVDPVTTFEEVGEAFTLRCSAQGDAQATITWSKTVGDTTTNPVPESPVYVDGTKTTSSELRFSGAQTSDTGSYKCTADFSGTTVESAAATVTVLDIGISEAPVAASYLVDEEAILSCKVKNPETSPATVSWILVKDSSTEVVSSDYIEWENNNPEGTATLRFRSATIDNAGSYKCKAVYTVDGTDYPRESAAVNLFVRELSVKLEEYTLAKLPDDSSKTFACTYKGDDGISGIAWTLDGGSIPADGWETVVGSYKTDGSKLWESTLTINSITKSSGGAVKCTVNFKGDTVAQELHSETTFVVHSISAAPEAETVSDAESVDISCTYSGTNDPDTVQWKVDGIVKTSDDTGYEVTTEPFEETASKDRKTTLTVSGRLETDSDKVIACEFIFSTELPEDTLTATTTLVYRGIVTELDANYYSIGDSVSFTCGLGVGEDGAVPHATEWYFNHEDGGENTALENAGNYAITTDTEVDDGKFETVLSIARDKIALALAGKYKCIFKIKSDTDETYESEGRLDVRLVTVSPSDATIYGYKNSGLPLSCTLDASDTQKSVSWTGPDGAVNTGLSTDPSNPKTHILTLANDGTDVSGQYSCQFEFEAGSDFSPSGNFPDVNVHLITMTSPADMYSTYGSGIVVSFTCEVTSESRLSDLKFYDGSFTISATKTKFEDGKTIIEYMKTVHTKNLGEEYSCRRSDEETSENTSTLTVLSLSKELETTTGGQPGSTVDLVCRADWNAVDANKPVFTWTKGSSAAEETKVDTEDESEKKWVESKLPITLTADLNDVEYSCTATYTGLTAGKTLTSTTTVKVNSITVTPANYQIKSVGETAQFTCVAQAGSDVNLQWRKRAPGYTDSDPKYTELTTAQQEFYDPGTGTRKTTLTLGGGNTLQTTDTSDSIECFDASETALTATMELDVYEFTSPVSTGVVVGENTALTCTVTKFDKTPVVEWFKKGTDADASKGTGTNPSEGQYEYAFEEAAEVDVGVYYCKVTYDENDDAGPSTFKSEEVNLFVRQIDPTPTTPVFIHTGETISLDCSLKIFEEIAKAKEIKWYKDGSPIVESSGVVEVTNQPYDGVSKVEKSTYTDNSIDKNDGGVYKCEFVFDAGEDITFEITVHVHLLTALESEYLNPEVLDCVFDGSNEPTISWWKITQTDDDTEPTLTKIDPSKDEFAAFSLTPGTWEDGTNTVTDKLNINLNKLTDATSVTCKLVFDGLDDPLETKTTIHKREITDKSETTYSLGESITLQCVFFFGESGTGPVSVAWKGIDSSITAEERSINEGTNTDGSRTTTLTFPSTNDVKFAGTYTCSFYYSDEEEYEESIILVTRLVTMEPETKAYVHTNDGFSLTCTFTGEETPSAVTWKQDSKTLVTETDDFVLEYTIGEKKAELKKTNPSSDDDGEYTCQFTMEVAGAVPTASTTITVGLLTMTQPEKYYGAAGGAIALECKMKAETTSEIYWFKDGQLKENVIAEQLIANELQSTYSISELKSADHDGVWSCSLSDNADLNTHKEKSINTVTLRTLDFIQQPPEKTFGADGVDVKISCKTSYGVPGVSVKVIWEVNAGADPDVDGEKESTQFFSGVTNDDTEYMSSLTIAFTSDMLEKSYSCKFTFSGDGVGTTNSLTSSATTVTQMAISGLEDTLYIKKGKRLSLSCTAFGGSATTISWTHDGKSITSGIQGTPTWQSDSHSITSNLVIDSVDSSHDGNYVCQHSGDSDVKDIGVVDVYEVEVTSKEVKSDTTTVLTCSVKGITKPFTFVWADKDNNPMTAQSEDAVDGDDNQKSELTVGAPKTDTSYTCTVSDPLGTASDPMTVELNVFEITTTSVKARAGENAELICEISGITEAVTVVFNDGTKDLETESGVRLVETGAPLGVGATKQTAKLTLYNVQEDATFTCKVTSGEYPNSGVQTAEVALTMFGVSIDIKYAIKKVGEEQDLVCTGDGDANIDIVWTETGEDTPLSAALGDYDSDTGTKTSTLSFTNLRVEDVKEYTCTVNFGDGGKVSAKVKIDVVDITASPDVGKKSGDDAVFSCDYNTFSDATPTVKWFKKNSAPGQQDAEQSSSGIDNSQKGKSTFTLSTLAFAQSGDQFYCQVQYQETASGATEATTFDSEIRTLYVRELVTSQRPPQYIHVGDTISLVCDLKVKTESELASVKWYIGSEEIDDPKLFDNADFDVANTLKKTTYTDAVPDKTEGGIYKCEFTFTVGDTISLETTVAIHFLTQWDPLTLNEDSLKCEFKGTNEPTFEWFTAVGEAVTTGADSPYGITPGSWLDNAITSTLTIDKTKYPEVKSITCKITFSEADVTDPLETTTAVHFREIEQKSETTYTTGENVELSCVFDFTKGGTGPTTVKWTFGTTDLVENDEYTVDPGTNGVDGKRTTKLTLKDIDDAKYAQLYTCDFEYSDTEEYVSDGIQVVVRVVNVEPTQYSHTNANFKITCSFVGSETPTSVSWARKGSNDADFNPITSSTPDFDLALIKDQTEAVLTKGAPTTDDNAEYTCEWQFTINPTLKPTGKQNLFVALLQMTQKDLSPINEAPDLEVTLDCTVSSDQTLDIYWYKGSQYLRNLAEEFDDTTNIVTSTLTIDKFTSSDIGEYSCRLDKDGSTSRVSVDTVILKLQGLETVPVAAGPVYVEATKPTVISCKIDHKGTITWTKDGDNFDDSAIFEAGVYDSGDDSTTSTLTFSSATNDNDGVYVCTYKTLSASFTLDVYGVEVTNKEVKSGEETELVCRITDTTNVFSFAWTDSVSSAVTAVTDPRPGDDNIQESKITVTPTEDTTYKCSVTDPIGNAAVEPIVTLNVFEIVNPTEVVAVVGVATSMTCGVTGNTGSPIYEWYKVGQDTPVYQDPGNAATSTYTINDPQFANDGAYKCKIAMKVGDFTNDAFDSATAELIMKLYPKELTASFGDETTVKQETDTLVCTYKGDNDVASVVWTSPAGTIDSSKVDTTEYSESDRTVVSTYTFTGVGGKDGGDYTCTFNFNKGTITPLSKKTKVTVAVLTQFDAITVNQESLDCAFIGTYEPGTVKWYTGVDQEVDTSSGSAYSITPGSWSSVDNSITSTLNIDKSKYTDVVTFTCVLTFTDTFPGSDAGLQTLTALHFREIEEKSETTYSTGNDVTISCVFDFTKGGTGPTSVEWSQIASLTMAQDYLVDLGQNGADGKRTTSLTLKGIDDAKFAETYSCSFIYSDSEKYSESVELHVRVATVDKESQYVHTNANFKITCDFVGKEKPTSVTWSHKATSDAASTPVTSDTTDFGLELIKDNTQAILTKSKPVSADDGEYSCAFQFTENPSVQGTAKANIVVALLQMPQHTSSPINETPGQEVVLTCTVKSETPMNIYWYKGATPLTNDYEEVLQSKVVSSELTIASFGSGDAGEYSCRLDNDGTLLRVSEQRVILKIQGLETTPTAAGNVYVELEKPLTLACKIDNRATVTWTKNGSPFEDSSIYSAGVYDDGTDSQTSTLTFDSVTKDNEGVYVCTFESLSATFTVDVFDLSVTSKEVKSGAETVLTCKITDITTAFTFTWTDKDGREVSALSETIKDETHEQESELTVTPTEDTTYTCTVTDASFGKTPTEATLNVFEITAPSDVYAVVGVTTSMSCGVTGNTGTPSYVWYKQGEDTPVFTDPETATTSTYSITDPQFANDGAYYCKVAMKVGDVTNDGFDSETANLVMRQVTPSFGADTVVKGATETLVCTFKGDDDVSSVVWTNTEGSLPSAKIVTSEYEEEARTVVSTFTLSEFDGADGGAYTCTFNFNNGDPIAKSTNVIIYSLQQLEARYFSPEHIELTFEGTFEPTITWYISGNEYNSGTNTQLTPSISSAWSSNAVTFKLAFKMSSFGFGLQPFTVSAKLSFGDKSTEELTTQDATVYKRELIANLAPKYTITGDEQEFECKATGEDNTAFTIKWYLDDELLDDSQDDVSITDSVGTSRFNRATTLTVDNTRSDFNGMLKCQATWSEPAPYTTESTAEVTARGAFMEEFSYSDSNGDGVMVCNAWNTNAVTITWKDSDGNVLVAKDNEISINLATEDRQSTSTLKLLSMKNEQAGDYTCEVKFALVADPKILSTKLQLLSAKIEHSGPDHGDTAYMDIGTELLITCTYSGEEEPAKVEWLKGTALKGDPLTDQDITYIITTHDYDPSTKTRKSVLALERGAVEESGVYTCRWEVTEGAPTATLNVRVMGLEVTGAVDGKTYSLDGSLTVACKYSGIEPGAVTWFKGSDELVKSDEITMTEGELADHEASYTLTISAAEPGVTDGQYTCKMTYDDGYTKSAETTVEVRTAAVVEGVSDTPVSNVLVTDGTLNMRCIYKGVTLPNGITWFYGSTEIDFDSTDLSVSNSMKSRTSDPVKIYQSEVNLGIKTMADEGQYSCRFHLDDGQDPTAEASVKVVSVTTPEVCVFVDYGVSTTKVISCSYTGSTAALSFKMKFPDTSEVAGELSGVTDNTQTGTFELIEITDAKEGTYECIFDLADDHRASTEIKVTPRRAVASTSVGTTSPRLLARSSIILTCTVASGAKYITWYKGDDKFSDYEVVEEDSTKSEITFEIENDSGGTFTCKGVYYSDDCPSQRTFTSQEIKLEVIQAAASTQPKDATATLKESASFECIFPDPFGESKEPVIQWRKGKQYLIAADLYNDLGDVVVDGSIQNKRNPGTYTTILTIAQVTMESAGQYTCTIKWDELFIHSDPATLIVRHIQTGPSTVNVAAGADAKMTCIAVSDAVATITFHKASDDSPVLTVTSSDDSSTTSTSTITTTGLLTISAVSSSHADDYYCKATWGDHTVKSSDVYLSVLGTDSSMADSWGVSGLSVQQLCIYSDKLMSSSSEAVKDEDERDVYAETSVAWEYDKEGTWTDIADNDKISAGNSYRNADLHYAAVKIGPLASDEEELSVRCKVTYTSNEDLHLQGGVVTSSSVSVKVIRVTSFELPSSLSFTGDTVTLSCSAVGPTKPVFTFRAEGADFSADYYTEVSGATSVVDGGDSNLYNSEYQISVKQPNILLDGQTVVCEAAFDAGSVHSEGKELKTYYKCDSAENKARITLLKDDFATISYGSLQADGSLTASTQCIDDTDTVKYTKAAATANSGPTSTCSKDSGTWTPYYLSPCQIATTYEEFKIEQTYDLEDWTDPENKYELCNADASAEYTKEKITEYLTSTDNAECGARHVVPCLKLNDGTCSIKANTVSEPDLNGCSWDKSTKTLVVFVTVQFTPIIETIQDKENAVTIADKVKMKFFECGSSGGSKRNAVLIEILDRGPVDTNIIITNATHISGDDPSIDLSDRSSEEEREAKFRLLLIVGSVCFAAVLIIVVSLLTRRRKSKKSKTLHVEVFPGKLVISDA